MALTMEFKLYWQWRSRRSRREEVGMFLLATVGGLCLGAVAVTRQNLGWHMTPYVIAVMQIYRAWPRRRVATVGSLDDRAMLAHGVEFAELNDAEQKVLLRQYRVGSFMLPYAPDERDEDAEHAANATANTILRWLLPLLAAIYVAGWKLLPPGVVRAGFTNAPVVLIWMFLLVLALPQMVRLWTEPDEVGEARVAAEAEA